MGLDEVAVSLGWREEPEKAHVQEPVPMCVCTHRIGAACSEGATQVFVAVPRTICRRFRSVPQRF